ncbi:PD-(D/E)XK nuclease family protein [Pygmaiobacter massiliensis]|uniref:PD-(D/E)XK nuclease family protein n=1 Tax=Pygmaiobacter massiliensis TaxID=1917873 RepID=UPI00289B10B8|nr:PD-(D/E)XK nuclease family protein [Pygmaiobacter massiliensis]
MLNLLLGTSGTGKTTRLLESIAARAKEGKRSIYLVPEQFSQAAELLCYETLGERLSPYCTPASFRTLSERIENLAGGGAVPTLSDAGRCVFVRRAIEQLGDEVKYYHRHRHNATFLASCAEVIQRFKSAGADCETLYDATREEAGERLSELALIYSAYEGVLAGKALDPEDRISRSAAKLTAEMAEPVAFFIDDFDTFTAPEYAMLRRMIALCDGVTVALCCDGLADHENGLGMFSPVKATAERLIRFAKAEQVPVATPVVLTENLRTQRSGITAIDALLCGRKITDAAADGVWYTSAADRYQECRTVAAKICQLIMDGARYSEIVVVCRDLETYGEILKQELGERNIPCFADTNTTAEYTAPSAFLRAALGLAKSGLSTRSLLALVKTDLCGLSIEQVTALENYAFVWQPGAADWREPFTLNPTGFGEMREEDEAQLALAEAARASIVPKAERFLEVTRSTTGAGLAKSLFLLLDTFGAPDHLAEFAAQLRAAGRLAAAEDALRSWDLAMDALDTMAQLLGEDAVTPAEFDELLLILLRGSEVGNVPRTLDTVAITSADRMRLAGPKYAFVVGLCEGEFPRGIAQAGLLTQGDRDFLASHGIEMSGGFEARVLLEEMFFYRALTSASDGLWLSAPAFGGEAKTLSSAAAKIVELLVPPQLALADEAYYTSVPSALAGFAAGYADDTVLTASLSAALEQEPAASERLAKLAAAAMPRRFDVQDTAAMHQLLGERLHLSPSKVEQFYKCSYGYFLQYVLRLRPRRPAELSPVESGSFVHAILEKGIQCCGGTFTEQTDEELAALVNRLADEYIAENIPPAAASGIRFGYLVSRLKANAARLLIFIREEQRQSSFHPEAFELGIGPGEEIAPLTMQTPDGQTVLVSGKVDRVDVLHRDGHAYVRVVDYKTGSKDFSLDEVYAGLNLQMLLYLFSICNTSDGRFAGAVPSGVLYLLADPAPALMEREKAREWTPTYKVDGLVIEDEMVLNAMDKQGGGVFIPVRRTSAGKISPRAKIADLAKLGRVEKRIEELIAEMATGLYEGAVDAMPLVKGQTRPCEYCDYRTVCCHEDGKRERGITVKANIFDEEEVGADA